MRPGLVGALLAGALLSTAGPARAWDLQVGVKYLPVSYTHPVSTVGGTPNGVNVTPLAGWNTTSIDNYVGGFILDGKLGFTLGMDFGYSSRNLASGPGPQTNLSFTQFGFALGSKYYLLKPRGGHVSPYVLFDFFKYFASVSSSAGIKGSEDFVGGLVSPLGIDAAVGAEYWFTNNFSLGAELLGLKYSYSAGSIATSAGGFGPAATATVTDQYVTFYTGITLNYRFEIAGAMQVREQADERAEPAPRPRARQLEPEHSAPTLPPPPPPKEPPPAEPESVD